MQFGKLINYALNPLVYVVLVISTYLLAFIESKVGWSSLFFVSLEADLLILVFYVLSFLGGVYFCRLRVSNKKSSVNFESRLVIIENDEVARKYFIFFIFSLLFFLIRFYKAGGVPLFNGMLRQSQGLIDLGGFFVYPVMAMQVLGIVGFIRYCKTNKKGYLYAFVVSLTLFIMFGERTSVLVISLSAYIYYISNKKVGLDIFPKLVFVITILVLSISVMQILRYGGAESLNRNSVGMSSIEFFWWVLHGDITGAVKFGSYVNTLLGDVRLNGNYSFGIFTSVLIPSYNSHGASFLRDMFTGSETAQSVASMYGLYIDFGKIYVVFVFFIGYLSQYLYSKFCNSNRLFWYVAYILFFFQLLTTIRSGGVPFRPMYLYYILVLLFICDYTSKNKVVNIVVANGRMVLLFSMIVSLAATLVRL